ncbi:MAG: M3 family oligoendopeptidase [Haliscomenobacter sp.]
MTHTDVAPSEKKSFIPENLCLNTWEDVLPYFNNLENRNLSSVADLRQWLFDKSELDSFLSESFSWHYIRLSQDSSDTVATARYHFVVEHIFPHLAAYEQKLNQKLVQCPFIEGMDDNKYEVHFRLAKNAVRMFRDSNVPVTTEIQLQTKEYGRIFSQMTIGVDGKQMTLQKASALLEEGDRTRRQQVYQKINERILQDSQALENLFDELLLRRNKIARNADFSNYRDYAFQQLNRFDYTPTDCEALHDSIAQEIIPILDELNAMRKQQLHVDYLRPWDLQVEVCGGEALQPFQNADDLLGKGIRCLSKIHPDFGMVIQRMREKNLLDLESRPGKKPGGYNMPLQKTRLSFIFMNATRSLSDLRTLMHECGHAIHFYFTKEQPLVSARRFPSEISELASMTMELLSMDYWDIFFPDHQELLRARINQLENVLKVLPWIATIDQFQHWVYTHPSHSQEERRVEWLRILRRFSSSVVDYTGMERYSEYLWHKQLHIFEMPFYYIEYGIAQLGAIAIWKRYRTNPGQAVSDYMDALRMGNTRPIGEVYAAAGIEFRFDRAYISELAGFVRQEIRELIRQVQP